CGTDCVLCCRLPLFLLLRFAPDFGARRAATAVFGVLMSAALIFVFCDIGYLAYFQSFFGEPYALLGMLLAAASVIAMARTDKPSGRLLALFIVAALAVATSKIQNAPLGFAFALLAWRMFFLREDRRWHRQVLTGIGVLLAASVLMIAAAPNGLKHINLYQSIFY